MWIKDPFSVDIEKGEIVNLSDNLIEISCDAILKMCLKLYH